jgi:hypothetical protein
METAATTTATAHVDGRDEESPSADDSWQKPGKNTESSPRLKSQFSLPLTRLWDLRDPRSRLAFLEDDLHSFNKVQEGKDVGLAVTISGKAPEDAGGDVLFQS